MNGLKILGILAALVLAVVVGLIVVLNSIDWSAYQEPIVAAVEDATGRKLGVDGAIGVEGLPSGLDDEPIAEAGLRG